MTELAKEKKLVYNQPLLQVKNDESFEIKFEALKCYLINLQQTIEEQFEISHDTLLLVERLIDLLEKTVLDLKETRDNLGRTELDLKKLEINLIE